MWARSRNIVVINAYAPTNMVKGYAGEEKGEYYDKP